MTSTPKISLGQQIEAMQTACTRQAALANGTPGTTATCAAIGAGGRSLRSGHPASKSVRGSDRRGAPPKPDACAAGPEGGHRADPKGGRVMVRTKTYRPSNGTEGDIFHGQYCTYCRMNAGEDGCDIELRAMANDIDDPEYPKEWIREWRDALNWWGAPLCTAFIDANDPERAPRCLNTLDMFGGGS